MDEWNNCSSKFSNRVLPPIFISTILHSEKFLNLAHYFPYDVKVRLLAHSRSFLANQKARNAIVGAENLLNTFRLVFIVSRLLTVGLQDKLSEDVNFSLVIKNKSKENIVS